MRTILVLALLLWVSAASSAFAAEDRSMVIPEILAAPVAPTAHAVDTGWVDEIQHSLTSYQVGYPNSNFAPYLEQLAHVRDAVARGDRRLVKTEMGTFLRMLAGHAYGVTGVAAEELEHYAEFVAPMEEYGISTRHPGSAQ